MSARTDADYEIEAAAKCLQVFNALRGDNFERVTTKKIMERTGFNYNYCFRALKTLKLAGLAQEHSFGTERWWSVTAKGKTALEGV